MSISLSLSNALSGLNAASRGAEVVSANVANALTEGYGRRVLVTSSQSVGGTGAGVQVAGVVREVDQQLLADRRLADAQAGYAGVEAGFYARLETAIGLPGSGGSLTDKIAAFDAALIEAASRPESDARLQALLDAAGAVQSHFNAVSDEIQVLRMEADSGIAAQVALLNDRLAKVDELNSDIQLALGSGRDATALMDQRQVLVDEIATVVPLRVVQQDHGQIAIYTATGATLLEGKPSTFGFTPAGTIVPEMTLDGGALGGLTLNGVPVPTAGPHAPIAGGSLAALFDQRDGWAVAAQADLDALARDLVERFQDPALDPTLAPGAPGLFTDAGGAFDSTNETGLSTRLAINPLADPAQGGALWRLRDGLGAAAPGPTGDATLLNGYATALGTNRTSASGSLAGAPRGFQAFADEYLSLAGGARQRAETDLSFARARSDTLIAAELAQGVDTDQEMQTLLLVEQAYAANARVIQTIDEMIQTLLSI